MTAEIVKQKVLEVFAEQDSDLVHLGSGPDAEKINRKALGLEQDEELFAFAGTCNIFQGARGIAFTNRGIRANVFVKMALGIVRSKRLLLPYESIVSFEISDETSVAGAVFDGKNKWTLTVNGVIVGYWYNENEDGYEALEFVKKCISALSLGCRSESDAEIVAKDDTRKKTAYILFACGAILEIVALIDFFGMFMGYDFTGFRYSPRVFGGLGILCLWGGLRFMK